MPDNVTLKKLDLPDDWTPEEDWCVSFRIPGSEKHVKQLIGWLELLGDTRAYERDATKTGAAIVARRWVAALNAEPIRVYDCEDDTMQILRARPGKLCVIEGTTDGGETWQTVYDPTFCDRVSSPFEGADFEDPDVKEAASGDLVKAATDIVKVIATVAKQGKPRAQAMLDIQDQLSPIPMTVDFVSAVGKVYDTIVKVADDLDRKIADPCFIYEMNTALLAAIDSIVGWEYERFRDIIDTETNEFWPFADDEFGDLGKAVGQLIKNMKLVDVGWWAEYIRGDIELQTLEPCSDVPASLPMDFTFTTNLEGWYFIPPFPNPESTGPYLKLAWSETRLGYYLFTGSIVSSKTLVDDVGTMKASQGIRIRRNFATPIAGADRARLHFTFPNIINPSFDEWVEMAFYNDGALVLQGNVNGTSIVPQNSEVDALVVAGAIPEFDAIEITMFSTRGNTIYPDQFELSRIQIYTE